MFTTIRKAWAKAEQTIGVSEPTQRLGISSEAHSGLQRHAVSRLAATFSQTR